MTHRRIVIGDVHGHYDTLMTLLNAIAPSEEDRVYFLGDLIDRGPKSAQVVEFVKQSGYTCLLGNHEQMVLEILGQGNIKGSALQAWLYSGGYSTVNSYGEEGISQDHMDWMRTLPTHLDLGDFWLVHAGVHPRLPIEKQTSEQFCWIREEFHGMEEPYFPTKTIITGHTITFTLPGVAPGKIAQGRGWLDIDTGAYHPKSGWLTGLDLTNSLIYQVHAFDRKVRKMSLEKAVTRVEPSQLFPRRSMLKL
ncbi:metallophosphoesterase family protein [Limnofasciculus baicalensis]|uniref:Serine/threonine protein phosphatase n=1 Tax=Limnofasciculus baicalensis BBK-W-15 TaxID=2699891 RepID=A0AAE3GYI8_9CYAN|nr:metallophosphoesterase family protein [Limnofasciculus baicalensis]MCP2732156.1 serine/threonine protein phosphatase [Limnofasciculus baicalensis BBK-W-15]